jgi:hypothetical protein
MGGRLWTAVDGSPPFEKCPSLLDFGRLGRLGRLLSFIIEKGILSIGRNAHGWRQQPDVLVRVHARAVVGERPSKSSIAVEVEADQSHTACARGVHGRPPAVRYGSDPCAHCISVRSGGTRRLVLENGVEKERDRSFVVIANASSHLRV